MWLAWTMSRIGQPNRAFAGDRGDPDPLVRSAIARASDPLSYARAVVALCTSRLLMPIVATGEDSAPGPDPDRRAEMAAVSVENSAGERALLAFTGLDSLLAWQRAARPVPCTLDDLAATVPEAGAVALLLDIAGPVPFTIEGEILQALASGRRLVELADGSFGWLSLRAEAEEPPVRAGD